MGLRQQLAIWLHQQKHHPGKLSPVLSNFSIFRSLRWRLTLEIGGLLTIALEIVTAGNSWQMQQILIATHTQNIAEIANRFPRDVEIYSDMVTIEQGIKKTIESERVPINYLFGSMRRGVN